MRTRSRWNVSYMRQMWYATWTTWGYMTVAMCISVLCILVTAQFIFFPILIYHYTQSYAVMVLFVAFDVIPTLWLLIKLCKAWEDFEGRNPQ